MQSLWPLQNSEENQFPRCPQAHSDRYIWRPLFTIQSFSGWENYPKQLPLGSNFYRLAAVQEVDNRRVLSACIVVVAELSLVRCPGVSSQKTKWKASVRVFIPKTPVGRLVVIAEKTSHCFSITLPSTEIRFKMLRSRKTVCFSEQIMSADKYPSIFSRQMDAIVYLNFSWVDSPWHMHFYRINDIFVIELTISFGTLVF